MRTTAVYSQAVEKAIADLEIGKRKPSGLYEPIAYGLREGGKRLRPVLLLMGCDAYSGDYEKALLPAAGIEMFHNFTLLHDDVMDNSDLRRGRPTVHRKWDSNTAILSGDCMLTLAVDLMMNVDDSILRRVLDIFNRMSVAVYEGQSYDMDFETRDDVTLPEYMMMIEGKTSALLGAAVSIGSIIGGASETDSRFMYDYGVKLGIAFQIQDDYLDLYGDPATFGKPIGGDVLNDKKTFLLLSARGHGGDVRDLLARITSEEKGEKKISAFRDVMTSEGIPEECDRAIEKYYSEAISALESTSLGENDKAAFRGLAEKLISRKR